MDRRVVEVGFKRWNFSMRHRARTGGASFPWVCAPRQMCLWDSQSLDRIDLSADSVVENNQDSLSENSLAVVREARVLSKRDTIAESLIEYC